MAINLLNIEDYVIQRVKEVAPDVNTEPGSAVRDVFVSPLVTVLQPLANEIHRIKKSQSLLNSDSLSDEDVDAILANIFIDREVGSKAGGTAIIIVNRPETITVPRGTVLYAKGGLKFYSKTSTTKGPESFNLNLVTGRYEVSIEVEAAESGSSYNINKGDITGIILTDTNIIGATNNVAFTGGSEKESSTQLLDRARASLGSRDLSTKRGAIDILMSAFEQIVNVNVVGFGDSEMLRDLIHAPNITIDGIEYPESEGVHLGGKIDIYSQVGLETDTAKMPNLISGEYGLNRIGFYTAGSDPNVLYEGTGLCSTTNKPIVESKAVTIDDSTISAKPGLSSAVLTEDLDYVFISQSPGLSNSMEDKKELRFIRGTGTVENLSINGLYIDSLDGSYYPLDTHEIGHGLVTPDIRGNYNLNLLGISPEEVESLGLFNHGLGSVDGSRSFRILPSQGHSFLDADGSGPDPGFMTRILHLSTGISSPLTQKVVNSSTGFTLMGWFNLSSIPDITEKRTLFNTFVDVGVGVSDKRHSLHIYVDHEGHIVYNTRSVGIGDQDNRTENPIMIDYVDSVNEEDNWVFLAFTYDIRNHVKEVYYANVFDLDIHLAPLETSSFAISQLDADYADAEILIGTSGDVENNVSETFDGLVDGVQIYFEPLSISYLETIRKNQNTATIHGVEKSSIVDAIAPIIEQEPSDNIVVGGKILMVTGGAAGAEFNIIGSTNPFQPIEGTNPLNITIMGTGSTPVTKIKNGDKYALTPYPLSVGVSGGQTTDVGGNIVNTEFTSDNGEIRIGVGIEMLYDSGLSIQDIQDFVDLNDTRPANADILAKHVFPIYVSGTLEIATSSVITEEELLVEVEKYINSLPVGGTFSVAGLINHLFDAGIQGLRLPLDSIVFTSRDVQFRRDITTGVEDEFISGKSQYFVPDGLSVSII